MSSTSRVGRHEDCASAIVTDNALGNASSIPPRLPDLSWVLRAVSDSKTHAMAPIQLTFVCLSYRGYWTSRGRPSEPGLRLDAEAGVRWIAERHERIFGKDGSINPVLLVWGQSIGSGVATNLAATGRVPASMPIRGLLLETPFVSLRAMLETLYPQKWLPYKYLWPFLRNHLDSWANLGLMAEAVKEKGRQHPWCTSLRPKGMSSSQRNRAITFSRGAWTSGSLPKRELCQWHITNRRSPEGTAKSWLLMPS